jgi:cytochrome c
VAVKCDREAAEMRKTWVTIAGAFFMMVIASDFAFSADSESRGKRLFVNCRDCHEIVKGAPSKVGPNLFGVVGRKLAADPGFEYPASHVAAGRKGYQWTQQSLGQYLNNPTGFMRKVAGDGESLMLHMVLRLSDARDRKDIVSYLKTLRSWQ